jgi:3D (Asp-Asp-Asp) domain-containing protein
MAIKTEIGIVKNLIIKPFKEYSIENPNYVLGLGGMGPAPTAGAATYTENFVYIFNIEITSASVSVVTSHVVQENGISYKILNYLKSYNIYNNPHLANGMPVSVRFIDNVVAMVDVNGVETDRFFNNISKEIEMETGKGININGVNAIYDIPIENEIYFGHHEMIRGTCISVYDGDTITIEIEGSGGQTQKIRFLGIDTRELNSTENKVVTDEEKKIAKKEKEFTQKLVLYKQVLIGICSHGRESHDRLVGTVYVLDSLNTSFNKTIPSLNLTKTLLASGIGLFYPFSGFGASRDVLCPKVMDLYAYARSGAVGLTSEVLQELNSAQIDLDNPALFGESTQDFNRIVADDDRPNFDADNRVRIGDCELLIPPSSIRITDQKTTKNIPGLRSKGSSKSQTGHGDTLIELTVYFTGEETINGTPITSKNNLGYKIPPGKTYYINGLRPLIAQFMRTPFLPIENNYINVAHNIQAVTLLSITTQTVMGYPSALVAEIKLMKFNWDAYLFNTTLFSDRFNWPLFRYYYQKELLTTPTLLPVSKPGHRNLSQVNLSCPRDDELKKANDEYTKLSRMEKPDYYVAASKIKETKVGQFHDDFLACNQINALISVLELDKQIKEIDNNPDCYLSENGKFVNMTLKHEGNINKIKEIVNRDKSRSQEYDTAYLTTLYSDNGVIKITIDEYKEFFQYFGSIGKSNETHYQYMVQKKFEEMQNSYNTQWGLSIANKDAIKTYLAEGLEDLIITSLTVSYENVITAQQMQAMETPSHQYLGSQDIFVRINMQTTNLDAVHNLKQLTEKVSGFARNYRQNVVTSLLDIKNEIVNCFGMTSCLVDSLTVSTVENNPEVYDIDLVLVDFNKTQRAREQFQSFRAIDDDINSNNYLWNMENTRDFGPDVNWLNAEKKMRTLELYPDLSLPTYLELMTVMAELGVSGSLRSNSNEIYVDPDFYIGIETDFISILKEALKEDSEMILTDLAYEGPGGETLTGFSKPGQAITLNQSVLGAEEGMFTYTQDSTNVKAPESPDGEKDIEALERKYSVDAYVKSQPTQEEKDSWYSNSFSALLKKNSSTIFTTNPTIKDINKIILEATRKYGVQGKDLNMTMALLKAIMEFYSSWTNIIRVTGEESKILPKVYLNGRSGMAGVDYTKVKSTNQIKEQDLCRRIAYDWEYNICLAISLIKGYYEETILENTKNVEEIIIAKYLFGSDIIYTAGIDKIVNNTTVKDIMTRYSRYSVDAIATTINSEDFNIANKPVRSENISDSKEFETSYITMRSKVTGYCACEDCCGKKEDPDDIGITASGARAVAKTTIAMAKGYPFGTKVEINGNIYTKQDHGDAITGTDIDIYFNTHQEAENWGVQYLDVKVYGKNSAPGQADTPVKLEKVHDPDLGGKDKSRRGSGAEDNYVKSESTIADENGGEKTNARVAGAKNIAEDQQRVSEARDAYQELESKRGTIDYKAGKIEKEDPAKSHEGSCQDMLEYDARGRLARAFPTYQLFFVDEGRWLSFHRLWDNLYGYNAVQSIDVHKSRLQPADTCAIVLNNTYGTISKYDSSARYYDEGITFENFLFGIERVEDSLIEARRELMNQLMIRPGCRIHLRMGYSADSKYLPVVFNGTITEIDVQEETTMIAQGDGIELTNTLQAAYGDTSGGIAGLGGGEPRNLILWLLDDRSFVEKWVFEDIFGFKTAPRGVVHFGNPRYPTPFNQTLAETGQNVYSVILDQNDPFRENIQGTADWLGFLNPNGDEPNISIYVYDKTAWDLIQICAMAANDYVAAVYPFNGRSTLFFGKPYYKMAYTYEMKWNLDENGYISDDSGYREKKKVFQQYRMYHSHMDIISNQIKASEDGVYTNVIGMYSNGQQDNPKNSVLVCADTDIFPQKQKTTMINTEIEASKWPLGGSRLANNIATSALADSLRLMYKGQLIVMGDPSAKPFDLMYIYDSYSQISGATEIREVVHSMSRENGFISMIVPDCCVATVDKYRVSRTQWLVTIGAIVGAEIAIRFADVWATKAIINNLAVPLLWKSTSKAATGLKAIFDKNATVDTLSKMNKTNYKDIAGEIKKTFIGSLYKDEAIVAEKINKLFTKWGIGKQVTPTFISQNVTKATTKIKTFIGVTGKAGVAVKGLATVFSLGFLIETAAIYIIIESISELVTRRLRNRQAVIITTLTMNGKPLEAGISGHKGSVVGDQSGSVDKKLQKIFGWAVSVNYEHDEDISQSITFNEVSKSIEE